MSATEQIDETKPEVRIATFNVENLMARFDFGERQRNEDRVLRLYDFNSDEEYEDAERARMIASTDDQRQHSALAIADTDADIVCLQEVENHETLEAFEYGYLYRMMGRGYRTKVWRKGNDKRGIDVALMARERTREGHAIEVVRIESHRTLSYGQAGLFEEELPGRIQHPNERVFRRDLLEVHLRVAGEPLTVYVTHLKAMGSAREGLDGERIDGREWSMPVRLAEARAIRAIIARNHPPTHNWVLCGDLNDYGERIVVTGPRGAPSFEPIGDPSPAIDTLLSDGFAHNALAALPPLERWTLYHAAGPDMRHLCQLDYILLSPALANANRTRCPEVIRAGQPYRTPMPGGVPVERYPRVGWDRPKASDHCPIAMTVRLA